MLEVINWMCEDLLGPRAMGRAGFFRSAHAQCIRGRSPEQRIRRRRIEVRADELQRDPPVDHELWKQIAMLLQGDGGEVVSQETDLAVGMLDAWSSRNHREHPD